jgi:uncharacterized C2H2 Zn-finger protein
MSESKSLAIYNCQTCMFITKNKKDYQRHLQSKKHRVSVFQPQPQPPTFVANDDDDDTIKNDTFQKPLICSNCHKVYKFRTSVYKHMKQCGVVSPLPDQQTPPRPESLTPEQIQYILIENKILKELLKKAIHGSTV